VHRNSAVCLVVERLRASALGSYGNTWYETRALDRLASESLVLDHAIADSPSLDRFCRSQWQGLHAARDETAGTDLPGLPAIAKRRGLVTALITDQPAVADHPLAAAFDDCVRVESVSLGNLPAQEVHQTQVAKLLAVASDWLDQQASHRDRPFLLWVHSRGMAGPWDAPLSLRNRLADPEDPEPPRGADVPCRKLPEDPDPDELFGVACAYAGQIIALDQCLAALIDQLQQSRLSETTLLTLIGARGFPLGEHGQIGPAEPTLYGETIHLPWLLRLPDLSTALMRSQALVQPPDLAVTLADWLGNAASFAACHDGMSLLPIVRGEMDQVRDRALSVSCHGQWALRTSAWFLRRPPEGDPELFVKPDDRWEANDVADRCGEVVAGLTEAIDHTIDQFRSDGQIDLPPLDLRLTAEP
jgi:hypothetical protein